MAIRIRNNAQSAKAIRNLNNAQNSLGKSLERLASGQRINKGADNPAGLIISENLRAQIASIDQAVSNSEFSISMVQTAEGALTEVNNLLIQTRQLALAASNEGANDENTLAVLQDQFKNALESIDRVAANTSFGDKKLLDGSRGISGVASGEGIGFVSATVKTRSSPIEGYDVDITQAATRASAEASVNNEDVSGLQLSVGESGKQITVVGNQNEEAVNFAERLKAAALKSDMNVEVLYDKNSKGLTIRHKNFGSSQNFQITSNRAGIYATSDNPTLSVSNGLDVKGTINGEAATADGQILAGNDGNRNTDGLVVRYTGEKVGKVGNVSVSQNSLVFQIGPDRGQSIKVAIDNTSTQALGQGINNPSKFTSLSDVDISSELGAQDALLIIDKSVNELARIRGQLGAFQKNSLESNVSTLQVAAENIVAAESSLRDTDIAREISELTKNKILTETAAATTAQANNITRATVSALFRQS